MSGAVVGVAARAASDVGVVRVWWPDVVAGVSGRAVGVWPPRESRSWLHSAGAADQDGEDQDQEEGGVQQLAAEPVERLPLVLREHPAPVNLTMLDAGVEVEDALFGLADALAEVVQPPVIRGAHRGAPLIRGGAPQIRGAALRDAAHDARRWHYPTLTGPGSRRHGLTYACVWIEGRLLGEDVDTGEFSPVSDRYAAHAADVAAGAVRRLASVLGRRERVTVLDRPCPWSGGTLTARTLPQAPEATWVACSTGPECAAPVVLRGGQRAWAGADLVGLWSALQAAGARFAA